MPLNNSKISSEYLTIQKRLEQLKNPTVIDILLQIEDILDSMDLYAFKNWINGKLVEGPEIRRHWVKIALLYPESLMPDPLGGMRLIKSGIKVYYEKASEEYYKPIDITNPPRGPRKPEKKTVWVVTMVIPRRLVDDMFDQTLEDYDDIVDTDDIMDNENTEDKEENSDQKTTDSDAAQDYQAPEENDDKEQPQT